MIAFRSSASMGKRQEYSAVAELLKRGFDVYMTLVDDQQIDCIVRINSSRYLDIQIKARGKDVNNPGHFPQLKINSNSKNYFFIFYDETLSTYWVIPSADVIKKGSQAKSGKNKGTYSIRLVSKVSKKKFPKWQSYENNFELLKGMS